jgi:hypothetical protein
MTARMSRGSVAVDHLRRLPFTAAFTVVVVGVALAKRHLMADGRLLERQASTNLQNLSVTPLRALAVSAVVVEGPHWLLPAASTAALLGGVEDVGGTRRAVGIAATGHVISTLLSQSAVWIAIRRGRLPESARTDLDIGTSYVAAAAAGALVATLPSRRRTIFGALAIATAFSEVIITRHVLAIGHGIALAIGYLMKVPRRQRRSGGSSAIRASQAL